MSDERTSDGELVRDRLVELVRQQIGEIHERSTTMARETWEVAPFGDQWKVTKEGATQGELFRLKPAAVARGIELASAAAPNGQLRIKRHDGTIEDESTYGKDPFPPRG